MLLVDHIYNWSKRIVLAIPFGVAFTLTVLLNVPARFRLPRQHYAGYSVLFGRPWAWLIQPWLSVPPTRWMQGALSYLVFLWIPAVLYSACLWLVFRSLELIARSSERRPL